MLYRLAVQVVYGFCASVTLLAMAASVFLLYYTSRMTPSALKEQTATVKFGRKAGIWVVVFSAVVTCAGIGSLIF